MRNVLNRGKVSVETVNFRNHNWESGNKNGNREKNIRWNQSANIREGKNSNEKNEQMKITFDVFCGSKHRKPSAGIRFG